MLAPQIAAIALITKRRNYSGLGISLPVEPQAVKMERKSTELFRAIISSDLYRHGDPRTFTLRSEEIDSPTYFLKEVKTYITIYLSNQEVVRYEITAGISPMLLSWRWSIKESFRNKDNYYGGEDAYALIKLLMNNYHFTLEDIESNYYPVYNFKDSKWRI